MSELAVVLAGGLGSRLMPFTTRLPKPLVPVGDKVMLDLVIESLAKEGFTRIHLALNHFASLIQAYVSTQAEMFPVEITHSVEEKPLGTFGPLSLVQDLPENFLVVNCDVISDVPYMKILESHRRHDGLLTVVGKKMIETSRFGVLEVSSELTLTRLVEKPSRDVIVNSGIYAVSRDLVDEFKSRDSPKGFDSILQALVDSGRPPRVDLHTGMWLDVGVHEDLEVLSELIRRDT